MFINSVFKSFFIFFAFSFLVVVDSQTAFALHCCRTNDCAEPDNQPCCYAVNTPTLCSSPEVARCNVSTMVATCRTVPSCGGVPVCNPATDPGCIPGGACGSGGHYVCPINSPGYTNDINPVFQTVETLCGCVGCGTAVNCTNPFGGPDIPHGGEITAYQSSTVACGDACVSEARVCNNGVLSGTYTNQNCSVNACPPPPASCVQQTQTFQIQQLAFPSSQIVLPHSAVACSGDGSSTTITSGGINSLPFNLNIISASLVVAGDPDPITQHTLRSISTELTYTWSVPTGGPASCTNPFGGPDIPHGGSTPAYQTSSVSCGNTCVSEVRTCNNGVLSGSYSFQTCSPASCANCTNPFGGADIPHGSNVTAYQSAMVACGNTCDSEVRTCNNGVLSGSYTNQNCTVASCGCGGLTCNSGEPGCFPMSSCGSGGHWICTAPDGDGNFNCNCTGCSPSTWLICVERVKQTIGGNGNCEAIANSQWYDQVTPGDCSGNVNHSTSSTCPKAIPEQPAGLYNYQYTYTSQMCKANGSIAIDKAFCCSGHRVGSTCAP